MMTPLSKEQVQAIKKANTISVRHGKGSSLNLNFEESIPINGTVHEAEYPEAKSLQPINCWHHEDRQSERSLFAIAEMLKKGDVLGAEWYEGNNNLYLNHSPYQGDLHPYSKLYRDELHISIMRETKGETKVMRVLVAVSVCADSPTHPSNTARICRRSF